ncbi:MAG: LCP family protein [Ignavibacteria bacterium]|nr:LCP family protein [Ignavibacteria bacterium]
MSEKAPKKKNKILLILLILMVIGVVSVLGWLYSDSLFGSAESSSIEYSQAYEDVATLDSTDAAQQEKQLEEVQPIDVDMQSEEDVLVSNDSTLNQDSASVSVTTLSRRTEPSASIVSDVSSPLSIRGKRINIAVIGVDARLGTNTRHADANHLISILPDSGVIQIFSVPRDTPAEANMPDTSGQNKLTIVYANRGIKSYLKELGRITGVGEIPYYMEVGFSQAMGIIEMLGFKDSKATLQVLRSRKGLGGDDYQRCYNQGQFIRQSILSHFKRFDGVMGDVLLRGGLKFTNTNITPVIASSIIDELQKVNFPRSGNAVSVHVRPRMKMKFKVYDFTNPETFSRLKDKIEHFNKWNKDGNGLDAGSEQRKIVNRLTQLILQAKKDTLSRPSQVVRSLSRLFEQRAWMQVSAPITRENIRDDFSDLLIAAYTRQKKYTQAQEVRNTLELEKKLFEAVKQK